MTCDAAVVAPVTLAPSSAVATVGGSPSSPAEKPSAVSEILIQQSTDPGQLVLDPFMGSGSVGVAAHKLGRVFLGNDLCTEEIGRAHV